jgi:hypothetical protein
MHAMDGNVFTLVIAISRTLLENIKTLKECAKIEATEGGLGDSGKLRATARGGAEEE